MKPNTRLLSITIPSLNAREGILKTYESLQGILGERVELVIQDHKGLSRLRECIDDPNVIITEEDDHCTAEASNIAADQANGKYLMFWGAGEMALRPGFLNALDLLEANPVDILFNCLRSLPSMQIAVPVPQVIQQDMQCKTPAAMVSKELFYRCGKMNTLYAISTDYALFVGLLKATTNYVVTGEIVVDFPTDGMTNVSRVLEARIESELIKIREYKKNQVASAFDLIGICYDFFRNNIRIG